MEDLHNDRTDDDYNRICWVISSAENFSDECINTIKENNIQLINASVFASMHIDIGVLGINVAFGVHVTLRLASF